MHNSIFKNENSLDNYSLTRYHMYSDSFGDLCTIEINIKSLRTNIYTVDKYVSGTIDELIANPSRIFADRYPDGKFAWFLKMIKIMAQYDYAMNPINWSAMYDQAKP